MQKIIKNENSMEKRNLVNPSNIAKCINCSANYVESRSIHNCKFCHKKLDKYFEINNTLLLIDLLLLKKEVIMHILFNRKLNFLYFTVYLILLFIGKIFYVGKIFYAEKLFYPEKNFFVGNFDTLSLLNSLFLGIYEFMLYFLFLKIFLSLKWRDILSLLLLSYYWLFNYFLVIWHYPGIGYTLIVEFIVLLNNALGLSCLCKVNYGDIFIACFISRILSIGGVRLLI